MTSPRSNSGFVRPAEIIGVNRGSMPKWWYMVATTSYGQSGRSWGGFASRSGRSDDLAVLIISPSDHDALHASPVVTSGVLIDNWGAPKLAPYHDEHLFVQATYMKILDQRSHGLIHARAGSFRAPC